MGLLAAVKVHSPLLFVVLQLVQCFLGEGLPYDSTDGTFVGD